jgi:hypothetical protein
MVTLVEASRELGGRLRQTKLRGWDQPVDLGVRAFVIEFVCLFLCLSVTHLCACPRYCSCVWPSMVPLMPVLYLFSQRPKADLVYGEFTFPMEIAREANASMRLAYRAGDTDGVVLPGESNAQVFVHSDGELIDIREFSKLPDIACAFTQSFASPHRVFAVMCLPGYTGSPCSKSLHPRAR